MVQTLLLNYGVKNISNTEARPQANGQAETAVKSIKQRMRALIVEKSDGSIPDNWDGTLFYPCRKRKCFENEFILVVKVISLT